LAKDFFKILLDLICQYFVDGFVSAFIKVVNRSILGAK
jgi:hypothetical protein